MASSREFELGPEADGYIRGQLALGRRLGPALLRLPIASGRAFTSLPASVTQEELADFDSGDVASGEENDWVGRFILDYLAVGHIGTPIGVFEHASAGRPDPWKPRSRWFTVEEEVYLAVEPGDTIDRVAVTVREAHWHPSIGVLSAPSGLALPIERGSSQPHGLLEALVAAADHVLIGAYDAEAWIIWSRRRDVGREGDADWLPFSYRGFHDVPRMVAVSVGEATYLLDCPFDEGADQYPPHFEVYELPAGAQETLARESWVDLPRGGHRVGRVPVAQVRFDATRRRAIASSFLEHLDTEGPAAAKRSSAEGHGG